MRYLVLSDIHSNLEALEAALDAAAAAGWDRLLVLGDLVGYGADPNAVVDRIRALNPAVIVRGNHDKVTSGIEDPEGFNRIARQAAEWTYNTLTDENRSYLAHLPAGPAVVDDLVEVCHGTPQDEDAYVASEIDALRALKEAQRPFCVFGHTHIPCAFRLGDTEFELMLRRARGGETLEINRGFRYLVNPGSVGQPRDGDPRAAFAIVDAGDAPAMTWFRVPYPIKNAQAKVMAAGLPRGLADRLAIGR
jgi:predicted phosphodiesterase